VLTDTFAGILDEYPGLTTIGVVPLGLSRYSNEAEMRPHTVAEAAAVCDAVEQWQGVFSSVLGRPMVFAADEYYLLANRPFPPASAYKGFPSTRTASAWCAPSKRPSGQSRRGARRPPRLLRLR